MALPLMLGRRRPKWVRHRRCLRHMPQRCHLLRAEPALVLAMRAIQQRHRDVRQRRRPDSPADSPAGEPPARAEPRARASTQPNARPISNPCAGAPAAGCASPCPCSAELDARIDDADSREKPGVSAKPCTGADALSCAQALATGKPWHILGRAPLDRFSA